MKMSPNARIVSSVATILCCGLVGCVTTPRHPDVVANPVALRSIRKIELRVVERDGFGAGSSAYDAVEQDFLRALELAGLPVQQAPRIDDLGLAQKLSFNTRTSTFTMRNDARGDYLGTIEGALGESANASRGAVLVVDFDKNGKGKLRQGKQLGLTGYHLPDPQSYRITVHLFDRESKATIWGATAKAKRKLNEGRTTPGALLSKTRWSYEESVEDVRRRAIAELVAGLASAMASDATGGQ